MSTALNTAAAGTFDGADAQAPIGKPDLRVKTLGTPKVASPMAFDSPRNGRVFSGN